MLRESGKPGVKARAPSVTFKLPAAALIGGKIAVRYIFQPIDGERRR